MVEGRARRRGPSSQRRGAREARPRSSRCAGASAPGASSAHDPAGQQPEPAVAAVLVERVEQQLHARGTGRAPARPPRARSTTQLVEPARRAGARIAAGTRRRPGTTSPSAARSASWSAVSDRRARRRARAPSRRCGGCPSRSRRSPIVVTRQRPLRRRHAGLRRVDRDRGAQRAGERLERRLDHVVGVRAGLDRRRAASARARRRPRGRTPRPARGRSRRCRPAAASAVEGAVAAGPEMSIAHAARASSIGTTAWP